MPQQHYEDDVTIQVPVLKAELGLLKQHVDHRFDSLTETKNARLGSFSVTLCANRKIARVWHAVGVVALIVAIVALGVGLALSVWEALSV